MQLIRSAECSIFGVSLHDRRVIRDGGYAPEWLLKCCVQSVCIESVFHREHYTEVFCNMNDVVQNSNRFLQIAGMCQRLSA